VHVTDSPLFVVRALAKSYGGKPVLQNLSFEVFRGECFVILGRSGSGKSVALRQLNALEKPDSGTVTFDDIEISSLAEEDLFSIRRRIAMLFQGAALFDSMNVFENVAFPMREHLDLERIELQRRVERNLEVVGLREIESRMPAQLSGGMRKRVALARSLGLEPEVVLFDEPTTGLDPRTSATIARLIEKTRARLGVTSIVVTHDLVLARRIADRVAFLDEGRFQFLGSFEDASSCSNDEFRKFLAGEEEVDHVE
jgi:phospholipid/cholesterol/gamma-HCH transport system ATP-binding protein